MNDKMENKYLFAHYLRGLAAISVVIAHYTPFSARPIAK